MLRWVLPLSLILDTRLPAYSSQGSPVCSADDTEGMSPASDPETHPTSLFRDLHSVKPSSNPPTFY